MKIVLRVVACCCGGVMGAAASAWSGGWCSGTMFAMLLIGCGCGLFVALHELAVVRAFEEAEKKAVQRSARKAAFFREVDKL